MELLGKVQTALSGKKTYLVVLAYIAVDIAADQALIPPEIALQVGKYLLPLGLIAFAAKINRLIEESKK